MSVLREDYYWHDLFPNSPDSTVDYFGSFDWVGPGPEAQQRFQVANLGATHSTAQTNTPGACGDIRDSLVGEYVTYQVDLQPLCSDFDTSQSDQYFTNAELTVYQDPAYGWSLLTVQMLSEADTWRSNYGAMTIDSGYRNPYHNAHLPQGVQGAFNSRHMHGDAVDIDNPTRDLPGRAALKAAFPTGPDAPDYVESTRLACQLICVHGDWRLHSQAYAHTLISSNLKRSVRPLLRSSDATTNSSAFLMAGNRGKK